MKPEKRTPVGVIREAIALRRKGIQPEGLVGVLLNLNWYLCFLPKSLFILFIARPFAIKMLPQWAKWHGRWDLLLVRLERRLLPRLSRLPQDQALVRAICREEEHNVAIFLQRGVKPDQRLSRMSPLFPYMVGRRKPAIVRLLLEAGANLEVREIVTGDTSLLKAVKGNDPEMVGLLLSHGARVDARGYEGMMPLIYAAGNGYVEVVRLLLEHQADPDHRCPDGLTAADYAGIRQHSEITALFAAHRECVPATAKPVKAAAPPFYRTWGWVIISSGGPLFFFYRLSQDPKDLWWLLLGVIWTNLVWSNAREVFLAAQRRKAEIPCEPPAEPQ